MKKRKSTVDAVVGRDLVFQLRFDAAIQDHVAKKATTKRAKYEAKHKAALLREQASLIEAQKQRPEA